MAHLIETSQTTTNFLPSRTPTLGWLSLAAPSTNESHRARCRYRRPTSPKNSIIPNYLMRASLYIKMCSSLETLGYRLPNRQGYSRRGKLRDPPRESLS